MHLSDQDFENYFSSDDNDPEVVRIANHLLGCPECQERADRLSPARAETSRQMSVLAPGKNESAQPVHQAFAYFEQQHLEKENTSMFDRFINSKYRFAWVALGVVFLCLDHASFDVSVSGDNRTTLFQVSAIAK